ncbi:MAG: efflux RND transporter periplasmic adaptor subunit [Deltaproteobacteria bacterium]|nr:efflux RND transporter periplasmic adaptor subunit [Deltaproteobacteria bacterium]
MPRYLTLTGSILADRSSEVAANVSGRITETRVERGDEVKRGDILALVDPKAAGLQAEAARAQSLSAASQVDLARQDCARADALFREGALAKSEYERQKTACSQLLYSSDAARAQAELARKLARDTAIRAPMSGTIGDRFVNVGEYVLPSSRIAAIYAIDQVRISISVPEVAVGQIRQGQSLDIHVSAYPTRTTPAIVRYVSPALRPATRDLIIEAIAKNPDRTLMPGMFATVLLELGRESQLTVPRSAIKVDGTVRRVFLARDNEAYEVVVQTGVEDQGQVAVLDSVDASDRVILNPPVELRDGSPITSL